MIVRIAAHSASNHTQFIDSSGLRAWHAAWIAFEVQRVDAQPVQQRASIQRRAARATERLQFPSITLDVICRAAYACSVIRSFADKDTRRLFEDEDVRRFRAIADAARRKLYLLHAVVRMDDLKVPPGNRLEALQGDRRGQHSIRINQQFRICFRWIAGHAYDVEIVDYH